MCNCTSCSYTDSFADKGFDAWPRGNPKGPRIAKSEYAAHVAHSYYGAIKREGIGSTGAAFYGRAAGITAKQSAEVLRKAFETTLPESAFSNPEEGPWSTRPMIPQHIAERDKAVAYWRNRKAA